MDLNLRDRVYVITGGARGLGRATADQLVADGARVVLSGRTRESLDAAVAELGNGAVAVEADNADPAAAGRLVAAAREAWGRVDGVLISVGGPPAG
ncbi:SDR family NAD(P)-dependent oxidoreductase, partial [Nocardioides jensenii]|uniref:SDR family NAD(P)-dependent oxidoreductase n=1 Tax=Nocardioides jensenii TaxID=1843 RepID=UPI0012F84794